MCQLAPASMGHIVVVLNLFECLYRLAFTQLCHHTCFDLSCVVLLQVGIVQFRNFTVADCGGGPKQHIVNGKDHGGHIEFAWVLDDRNRYNTELTAMAGEYAGPMFAVCLTAFKL